MIQVNEFLDKIPKLDESEKTSYIPFFLGNDSPLDKINLTKYIQEKDFVFVGTSLFRCVELVCALTKNEKYTPKIVIIDNSLKTSLAWEKIKDRFKKFPSDQNVKKFLEGQDGFLELILELMDQKIIRPDENIACYFNKFFKRNSFNFVQKVIENAYFLEQSWTNETIFSYLKDVFIDLPIIAYVSNIIDFIKNNEEKASILNNIGLLKPNLLLLTNLDSSSKIPTKGYILTEANPLAICELLSLPSDVKEKLLVDNQILSIGTQLNDYSDVDYEDSSSSKCSFQI